VKDKELMNVFPCRFIMINITLKIVLDGD